MNSHLVSIIIPTYNRVALLQEAIQSCIAQTYRPIECIVVDDGSTDNTKEVVTKIENANITSFTVKYIYQPNAGSQVARNTGTVASSGEFIQYLDSDDLLYPEKIEKQVNFLKENPECDGVWGGWAKGTPQKSEIIKSLAREDLLTQFLTEHCIHTLSFLFRRSLVEKIGPWDVNVKRNQEIDFQVRGLLAGADFQHQPQIGGLWRIHNGERIANTTGLKEYLYFFEKWEKTLSERGLLSENIRKGISQTLFWLATKNVHSLSSDHTEILKKAISLNPEIPFYNSKKMRMMRRFLNQNVLLGFWLRWYRKHLT